MSKEAVEQNAAFDKTTEQGWKDGLFQTSMQAIRNSHLQANILRAGLMVAGLFTDKLLYRELVTLFYIVTKELESKLDKLSPKDKVCQQVLSLGYHFTEKYEQDMAALYTPETWKQEVELALKNSPSTQLYVDKIQTMQRGTQLAGATFVLWGALIIGGGAAVRSRVEKLCGKEATHLFEDISGPGRADRREAFIKLWDSLAVQGSIDFAEIVREVQECMKCNNDLFVSLQRKPWWLQYVVIVAVALVAAALYHVMK